MVQHPRHPAVAAVALVMSVVLAAVPAAAQAQPAPSGQSPEDIRRRIQALQTTIEAQSSQRERILAKLDEVEAEISDLNSQVAQAGIDVARADSALERAAGRFDDAARALYKNPQSALASVLSARSLNEIQLARTYLSVIARDESDAFAEIEGAKSDQRTRRDELLAQRDRLRAAHATRYEFRDVIDASVAQEQAMIAELQKELDAAAASAAAADILAGLPATIEDCPGSGAGAVGGNPGANAAFAAVYTKYPFGPTAAIPPGFEAVGPKTSEVHSWYGACFHGHSTASGAMYDQNLFTSAALKYPLGTFLVVTNPANGRSILVYVNDRGPYVKGRTLDLSAAGAAALGTIGAGVAAVQAQVVRPTY